MTSRTAVYGPVRTVVGGARREDPPIPIWRGQTFRRRMSPLSAANTGPANATAPCAKWTIANLRSAVVADCVERTARNQRSSADWAFSYESYGSRQREERAKCELPYLTPFEEKRLMLANVPYLN